VIVAVDGQKTVTIEFAHRPVQKKKAALSPCATFFRSALATGRDNATAYVRPAPEGGHVRCPTHVRLVAAGSTDRRNTLYPEGSHVGDLLVDRRAPPLRGAAMRGSRIDTADWARNTG